MRSNLSRSESLDSDFSRDCELTLKSTTQIIPKKQRKHTIQKSISGIVAIAQEALQTYRYCFRPIFQPVVWSGTSGTSIASVRWAVK